MEINNLYYGILLYIIIIVSLGCIKPDFLYDNKKNKYKEYGTTINKTIFTLPVISVLLAIFIAIIIVLTKKVDVQQNVQNVQYVPIYYQQPIQPVQQIQPIQPIQPIQYTMQAVPICSTN